MKLFMSAIKGLLTILLCGVFFLGEIHLIAAIAPLSQKQLDEQSELIVTGRVLATEFKVQTVSYTHLTLPTKRIV